MIARERAFHCISNIRNRHVTSKVFFLILQKSRRSVGQRLLKLKDMENDYKLYLYRQEQGGDTGYISISVHQVYFFDLFYDANLKRGLLGLRFS